MDSIKNYTNFIKGLTEGQFNKLIKSYFKHYWGINEVVFTDGTNDGGVDLKYYKDKAEVKVPVQVTVQKTVIGKLKSDLKKISTLIKDHKYSSTFYFYCSVAISEDKQKVLKTEARKSYGINLEIVDSKHIASVMDEHFEIKRTLFNILGAKIEGDDFKVDEKKKTYYDFMTYGDNTVDIKNCIVDSYILHTLYEEESIKEDELSIKLSKHFSLKIEDKDFCQRRIAHLSTFHKLKKNSPKKGFISLSDKEKERIEQVKIEFASQKKIFENSIQKLAKKYSFKEKKNLYKNIYDFYSGLLLSDKNDFKEVITPDDYSRIEYNKFKNYVSKNVEKGKTKEFIKEIVKICETNDFIQRISSGDLFSGLLANDELESYLNHIERDVYLDTSFLLHLICASYQESDYKNPFYKSAVHLLHFIKKKSHQIKLATSEEYLEEVTIHFKESFQLMPFVDEGLVEKFGGTDNVFVNFFLHLKKASQLDYDIDSFEDFLNELGFMTASPSMNKFVEHGKDVVYELLEASGVDIFQIDKRTTLQKINIEFEKIHMGLKRKNPRSKQAIKNDSIMASLLFDKKVHNDDPYFITWDYTFSTLRKKINDIQPKSGYWHLYTPPRLLNHLSLLNLNISSEAISHDILAIMEDDLDIKEKVKSLLDNVSKWIDLSKQSGIKFAKKIAKFRKETTFTQVKGNKKAESDTTPIPIDSILFKVNDYYFNKEGKFGIEDLKEIFDSKNGVDLLIDFLQKQITYYLKNAKTDPKIFVQMDNIINVSLEDKKDNN